MLIIFLAVVTARMLNALWPVSYLHVKAFEYLGYLGWASSLGVVGWEIQTWEGKTPSERVNMNIAKISSMIGIFAFVLARELVPRS
ncbi:MAG: hypothetical protein ACHQT8_00130 [Chlamydiales bacterium]